MPISTYKITVQCLSTNTHPPSNTPKNPKNTNKSLLPHRPGYFQLKIKPHTGHHKPKPKNKKLFLAIGERVKSPMFGDGFV